MKRYSRVSYEDRCQISAMLKREISIADIAKDLGFDKSTIYREIKRNSAIPSGSPYKVYSAPLAQGKATRRKRNQRRKKLIVDDIKIYVNAKLARHWSPEQITGRLRLEKKKSVSHVTIYRYVYENKELKRFLRFGLKRGTGRYSQKKNMMKNTVPVSERPISANNRSRLGHWERDGMYGANRKQLLVCIERKTRLVRIGLMEKSDSNSVNELTKELLQNDKVLSITNDNGSEFRKKLEGVPVYHCKPLRPDQRGSVENVIGQLRSYVKRTTDLTKIDVKEIENEINNRPRKMFNYRTPYEVHFKKKVALVL